MAKEKLRFGSSPEAKKLRTQLLEIKAKKLYPRGYAKLIVDGWEGEKAIDKEYVYQVAGGYIYNAEVVDALLKIAANNKLVKQNEIAKKILS